ncbi:MAG: hypothetical protein QG646_1703 [Euryarchaeota archaeon]|nr:hypothetical protein [Euryarchaeota archaeon]
MKKYFVVIIDRDGLGKRLEKCLNNYAEDGWILKAIFSEENEARNIDVIFERDIVIEND